jgi:hypothetical protein
MTCSVEGRADVVPFNIHCALTLMIPPTPGAWSSLNVQDTLIDPNNCFGPSCGPTTLDLGTVTNFPGTANGPCGGGLNVSVGAGGSITATCNLPSILVIGPSSACQQMNLTGKLVRKPLAFYKFIVCPPAPPVTGASHYVAMGDSVPAGEDLCGGFLDACGRMNDCSVDPVCNGSDHCDQNWAYPCSGSTHMPACEMSGGCSASPAASYPAILALGMAGALHQSVLVRNYSCSGDTTTLFQFQSTCGFVRRATSELDSLRSDGGTADLVTLTLGADDFIQFAKDNWECMAFKSWPFDNGSDCQKNYQDLQKRTRTDLEGIFGVAKQTGKTVRITGYYRIFSGMGTNWTWNTNHGIDDLNSRIQEAIISTWGYALPLLRQHCTSFCRPRVGCKQLVYRAAARLRRDVPVHPRRSSECRGA